MIDLGSHLRDPLPHDQEQESRVQESAAQGGHFGVDHHSAPGGQTQRPAQRTRRRSHATGSNGPRGTQRPTRRCTAVRRRTGRSGSQFFKFFFLLIFFDLGKI